MTAITVQATTDVTLNTIAGILCCAFEGGSNYWYRITDYRKPLTIDASIKDDWGDFQHIAYPLSDGGQVRISDMESARPEKELILDLEAIHFGVQTMATKYPQHFADMMLENDDATTGDCLLQCCLFGEMVYG